MNKHEKISIEELLVKDNPIQDQIDDIIYELVRARKQKKITQIQLSKESGIPQTTISRMESLASIPTLQVLIKIANVLGLSLKLS